MPKQKLTPKFVSSPPKPTNKAKVDYFDSDVSGFLLEVSNGNLRVQLTQRGPDNETIDAGEKKGTGT